MTKKENSNLKKDNMDAVEKLSETRKQLESKPVDKEFQGLK